MTLRRRAFSGVRWTTASYVGRAGLQFVQLAILARVLSPADFGLIALVVSVMAILQIFADAGISNAVIHLQQISPSQLSSLYWLNVLVSLGLALGLVLSSPRLASWYAQPDLQWLFMLAAMALLINALAQQLRVVAQKQLNFAVLAKIELAGSAAGFGAAVVSALVGAGVYSLVLGSLTSAITGSVLAWRWLAQGWRPRLQCRLHEIRPFLSFGTYMIGSNLANAFNSQVDVLLGGKLLGAQAMGFYSVPKDLNMRIAGIINPIVTQVGLPVMAKAQEDEVLLKHVYLQTTRMTASVNFPAYVALGAFAPEIVRLLLGTKWEESVVLIQVFAIWALLRSTGNPVGSLLMAKGRADWSFKWNLALVVLVPLAIWGASYFGVIGMATVMTVLGVITYWPNWYFLVRPLCGARLGEYSIQMAVPFALSLSAGGVGLISSYPFTGDLPRLTAGLLIGGLAYSGLSWRFNRVWVDAMRSLIRIGN